MEENKSKIKIAINSLILEMKFTIKIKKFISIINTKKMIPIQAPSKS
jgi:hypothetical protein